MTPDKYLAWIPEDWDDRPYLAWKYYRSSHSKDHDQKERFNRLFRDQGVGVMMNQCITNLKAVIDRRGPEYGPVLWNLQAEAASDHRDWSMVRALCDCYEELVGTSEQPRHG